MDDQSQRTFPLKELALLLFVGIPALAVALLCVAFVWTYSGPQYDVVFVSDHEIGGVYDRTAALLLGTVSGAVGIFLVLRFRRRLAADGP